MYEYEVTYDAPNSPDGQFYDTPFGVVENRRATRLRLSKEQADQLRNDPSFEVSSARGKEGDAEEEQAELREIATEQRREKAQELGGER